VIQVRELNLVFGADASAADDDLSDVVEFREDLRSWVLVPIERFEPGPAWDSDVERLSGKKRGPVKEHKIVGIGGGGRRRERRGISLEGADDGHGKPPASVSRAWGAGGPVQRLGSIQPGGEERVLLRVEWDCDGRRRGEVSKRVKGKGGFLVVEDGDLDTVEVRPIADFATHGSPHGAPLSAEDGIDNTRYVVNKGESAGDV
jgi:hypothetical protein